MLSNLLRFVLKHSKAPKSRLSKGDEVLVWLIIVAVLLWLN
ncbi:hypothetical protein [uncultured Pseudophaeobacter sp.]|jgi:hypothetical protein|nr:hypothetical protein [uncultured Pseudophaeobacter sp.]